ncbi:uncharacterized protein RSE6_08656 [Rhynchosporium secalis]|uniref:Uncharacterized protein n=1 Tax=Rhynchosporium secalis TaxID=38038 RepID=A0A1E1MFX7_RHYSE|nr:uncharacterized protein RSE6_08656 [Rhynchosporium secalis]
MRRRISKGWKHNPYLDQGASNASEAGDQLKASGSIDRAFYN